MNCVNKRLHTALEILKTGTDFFYFWLRICIKAHRAANFVSEKYDEKSNFSALIVVARGAWCNLKYLEADFPI